MEPLTNQSAAGGGCPEEVKTAGAEAIYRVWACDNQIYGPIPMIILKQWVQETRVQRDTWVYLEEKREWRQAGTVDEIRHCFPDGEETIFLQRQALDTQGIDIQEFRQFPIFEGLPNHELCHWIRFAELLLLQPGEVVMRRGEPGDAIFFVLSGRVRAQIRVGGDEKVLSKIGAGEFFGEMAMLTQAVRSADVFAEEECRLVRFSAAAFRSLIEQNPSAAAPMLYALSSLMARRVLAGDKRLQQEVVSGFVWR